MKKFENREFTRHQLLGDLYVVYEGTTEEFEVDLTDLCTRGMFIST